ncbi:MAG: SPFH domain-containing protein [Burkholderiales bacterium]|nr:SPFH domain-containing protein [Burkholderiales bacterium]
MNPGNNNKNTPNNNIDEIVDKLNKRIGLLLGKRRNSSPQKQTSNLNFSLMLLCFAILLWLSTGFYYLADNQYGLIFTNGKLVAVENGMHVGFTQPFPFGDIKFLDNKVSDYIDLKKNNFNGNNLVILSRDLHSLKIDAKFNYQVINPQLVYTKLMLQNNNIDKTMLMKVKNQIRVYLSGFSQDEITQQNLTILANDIKNLINKNIATYGVKVVKLNINSIISEANESDASNTTASTQPLLVQQLLQQANLYKQNKLSQTRLEINQFNQLLPQYKKNPKAIVEQLYFDTLEAIPVTQIKYSLLDLNLSELLRKNEQAPAITDEAVGPISTSRSRAFSREVKRMRDLNEVMQ